MEKIVIPKLIGGIGNHLFTLAAAIGYCEKTGRLLKIHKEWKGGNPHCNEKMYTSDLFPNLEVISNIDLNSLKSITCRCFEYGEIPDLEDKIVILDGYGQNLNYFPYDSCILKNIKNFLPKVFIDYSNLAFIHIRRNDYVGNAYLDLDLTEYRRKALNDLTSKNPSVRILILSDDLQWANENIPKLYGNLNWVFLERQTTGMETLYIMSECKTGCICANSTLSWWGSWLSESENIYMPKPWSTIDIPNHQTNLYPKNVTVIDV